MIIEWPDELPAPLLGSDFAPLDPQIRTPMQSGRVFVRRNFTAVPVPFRARWIFKKDEHAVRFEQFYKEDTTDGTVWFWMPLLLPQGRGPYLVQFQGIYTGPVRVNAPGMLHGNWEYSANMMMFLRPGD